MISLTKHFYVDNFMKNLFIRKYRLLFITVLLFSNSFSQLANGHVLLNFPKYLQEKDSTCWAAVSQNVIQYFTNSTKITQDSILLYSISGANKNVTNTLCGSISNRKNVKDILAHYAQVPSTCVNSDISFELVATFLDNDKPIVVRWAWLDIDPITKAIYDLGKGHFVVITGYAGTDAAHNLTYYVDPFDGYLHSSQNYAWIQYAQVPNYRENIGSSTNPIWCDVYHSWSNTLEVNVSANPPPPVVAVPIPIVLGNNGTNGQAAAVKQIASINYIVQQLLSHKK